MTRAWLGTALLAGSWLFGLDYFQPGNRVAWLCAVAGAVALLSNLPVYWPERWLMQVAVVLSLPAVWLLPWPYKAIPVLLAAGLLLEFAPLPRNWPRHMGQGAVAAAVILLVQALTLWLYASGTARNHECPWPIPQLFALLPRMWGLDTAVDGSTIAMRFGEELYRIGATWELVLDPATVCCLAGGLVLLGLVFLGSPVVHFNGRARRCDTSLKRQRRELLSFAGASGVCRTFAHDEIGRPSPLRQMLMLVFVLLFWAPLRAAFLMALVLHKAVRVDPAGYPNVADVWVTSWMHLALLGGFVFLAVALIRGSPLSSDRPQESEAGSVTEQPPAKPLAAAIAAGLGVALLTGWIEWAPVGQRQSGRVMIMEKHSTWEPTTEPYGTKVYGEKGSYNYAASYAFCAQSYSMSQLLESEPINDETLGRCDALVIKTPTARYSAEEVEAVVRFVEQGGALLLIGDHTNVFNMNTYLNDIARHFGFTFRNDLLFRVGDPYYQPYRRPLVAHPIVQHMPPMTFAVSCSIEPGRSTGRMVIRSTGLWNLPPAYQEINYHPQAEYRPQMQYGAWCQLWSTSYGEGRVLAFADSTLFSNFCVFQPGKTELLMGMLEWLNHRSVLDRPSVKLWLDISLVLGGGFLLAAGVWLARHTRAAWMVLAAAALAGWSAGALAVIESNRRAMPLVPVEQPMTHVAIDRTLSEVPLFTGAFPDSDKGEGYGLFEQWIPRVGNFTSRRVGERVFDGDALVILCPTRAASPAYRQKLMQYVQAGGKLLVVDSPEIGASTANSLLRLFGLESRRSPPFPTGSKLKIRAGGLEVPLNASCRISGGETLAWLGDVPAAACIRFGEGTVTAIGFGSLFNDANMGFHWLQQPSAETRARYEVLYALLRSALGETAVNR
jgi:hypothetical protein